MTTPKV